MNSNDKSEFAEIWTAAFNMYNKSISHQTLSITFESLSQYDMTLIRKGLAQHIQSPETGQFCPKPADIIKQIEGTFAERAAMAWSLVEYGIRHVGAWSSIKFDDPVIHIVLERLGGWVVICKIKENELAFKQKDFINSYQHTLQRSLPYKTPSILKGIIDCQQQPPTSGIQYTMLNHEKQLTLHRHQEKTTGKNDLLEQN